MFWNKNNIFENGRTMILAYDQGFEHGPADFNMSNADPEKIFKIALNGGYSAFAVQAGIAEKYYKGKYRKVPLIVKLNAKDRFDNHDPVSLQHTSVAYAKKIGAAGVGYTIYLGSSHEQRMFVEFGRICEEAKKLGLFTMCWMYPRGNKITNELSTETICYGSRIAMELGADIVKIKYNGDSAGMKWIVECAGKTKVVVAGGSKVNEFEFLKNIHEAINSGAVGLAVGRNVWQDSDPLKLSANLRKVIFLNKSPQELKDSVVEGGK
ncbi:hypothetical protein K9L67_05715 [Candidatus Woesearchaeota archaeon]|nr:hypothetical protein [Candidatus Woesearchaeota archaeon]MCF7901691.1 hypothetical protein [Candidatus Woesearchaeota archaeon]MCF8013265.1 hypothetical protein [Candidatus Woesearchaeota archaeon]